MTSEGSEETIKKKYNHRENVSNKTDEMKKVKEKKF